VLLDGLAPAVFACIFDCFCYLVSVKCMVRLILVCGETCQVYKALWQDLSEEFCL
jgi:hypothetical protein